MPYLFLQFGLLCFCRITLLALDITVLTMEEAVVVIMVDIITALGTMVGIKEGSLVISDGMADIIHPVYIISITTGDITITENTPAYIIIAVMSCMGEVIITEIIINTGIIIITNRCHHPLQIKGTAIQMNIPTKALMSLTTEKVMVQIQIHTFFSMARTVDDVDKSKKIFDKVITNIEKKIFLVSRIVVFI